MPECKHTKILTIEHLRTKKREELTSLYTSNYFIFQDKFEGKRPTRGCLDELKDYRNEGKIK